ncbi:MAG: APC family permease [Anaerolineaceae bacterium]|nr:APC family permease [Anaerolineaceae bacterium]
MLNKVKNFLIGTPLPTFQLKDNRLSKVRALATFSPDALSSIAYANQEIYLGLIVAGSAGLSLSWPIGLTIVGLLTIVAFSYYQTIFGYPSGGGSFIVASKNLGVLPGVIAAAALMIDYVLNAAVSLTAGIAAVASAFPALWPYRIVLSLSLLLLITIINMRGIRESGTAMAVPVYLFLISYFLMLAYGLFFAARNGPAALASVAPPAVQPVTLLLVLHTFATGCTALTGIEAISNGIPAFKPPQAKNAGKTLIIMAFLMGALFLGSIGLTQYLGVVAGPQETILSALARKLLGFGPAYILIQVSTTAILAVAANTSFADFPRLSAILASENFLPRQLTNLGDRLVYNNGILLLAGATAVLIIVFGGDTHLLIPLFAVGAFLAFTLSQAGMVVHWYRERSRGWFSKSAFNGLGAVATGITVLIVGITKFTGGAWITVIMIPLIVMIFLKIRKHYESIAKHLSLRGLPPSLRPLPPPRVVVPISGVHRGIVDAINFAQSISSRVTAVYIELQPDTSQSVRETWEKWWPDVPLVTIPSPYRSIVGPLIDFLDEYDQQCNDGQQAVVVLPEFIPAGFWQNLFHNQTALQIKAALLYRRRHFGFQQVVIDVPYHLRG